MAAAVTAKALPPPASPFAALLRRSKFTAHDQKISQVYASFGGDAHRGNYGLKRPIPLRKRRAHITVSEVDSRENQTVWKGAEQPARWISMWDEVSVHVAPQVQSSWHKRLGRTGEVTWTVDSELVGTTNEVPTRNEKESRMEGCEVSEHEQYLVDEAEEAGLFAPMVDMENIHAMSEQEFERYVAKIRKLRPQFKRYLDAGEAIFEKDKPPRSMYEFSQSFQGIHRPFLSAQAYKEYNSPDSEMIQQQPHLNGGLTYSASSPFQAMYTRKPQPGRYAATERTYATLDKSFAFAVVTFAGMTTEHKYRHPIQTIDWRQLNISGERDPSVGVSKFRIESSEIVNVPRVVGPRTDMMRNTVLFSKVQDTEQNLFRFPNPHRPGSAEYIQHEEGARSFKSNQIIRSRKYPSVNKSEASKHSETIIATLETFTVSDELH